MLGFLAGLLGLTNGPGANRDLGQANPLRELLASARSGDRQAREELIGQYTPLVLRLGAEVTGRYIQVGRDEEVSVGLLALNEAIDRYDPSRAVSFVSFAEVVIRRRLIDHYRRRSRHPEVPLSSLAGPEAEGDLFTGIEERAARAQQAAEEEARERRAEIDRFSRRLLEFGIRFTDLASDCPRHGDARERAIACARVVATHPLLWEHLVRKHELPLKGLSERVEVSRKTLERQRRYIIAVALIISEDYDYLREYIVRYLDSVPAVGGEPS